MLRWWCSWVAQFHFWGEGVLGLILHCKAVLICFSRLLCLEILLSPMSHYSYYCFRKGHHPWVCLINGCPLDIQPHGAVPDHGNGCQVPPLGTLLLGLHSACCQFPFLPTSLGPSVSSLLCPSFTVSGLFVDVHSERARRYPVAVFM